MCTVWRLPQPLREEATAACAQEEGAERNQRPYDEEPAAAREPKPRKTMFPVMFAVNTRPSPK